MIKDTCFIIPVYNEEKRVSNIYKWIKWIRNNTNNSELVIALNGCSDSTEELVNKIKYKKLKILITKQRGRGYAIINALKNTTKSYSCICSIDDAWDKKFYLKSFNIISSNNNLFCVYGPKSHKLSKQNRPLIRKFISILSMVFLRIIFFNKIKIDTQCIKIFRVKKNFIKKIKPYNYFFDTQFYLLSKNMGLNYDQIPVNVKDNNINSKVKLIFLLEFMFEAFHYIFTNRIR